MKVLFIIPGSGDSFYCGNCFRDNLQASALRRAGHDVTIMPLYLPLNHPSFQADTPLFFPATTYYTAQKLFGKRRMPQWLERITESRPALQLASFLSGATSASGMEGMTLSMITGDDPAFAHYVTPLVDWIRDHERPDIIHLSSTLLIGIAKELRRQLATPIVCSAQDEEVWIDSLKATYAHIAWQGIAQNAKYITRFITTSQYYRGIFHEKIPTIKDIEVIYPGIDRAKYASTGHHPQHPTIGFFYRMNHLNGLDILAEAFVTLKKQHTIPHLKLKIGGGYTGEDKRFLRKVKQTLKPYADDVEMDSDYSLDSHAEFYRDISVICAPLRFEEGVGLYLCEAFAAGRPAVVPSTGSFPEIVGDAGLLYSPNHSEALAEALQQLLTNETQYARATRKAEELSVARYNDQIVAERLIAVYTAARE